MTVRVTVPQYRVLISGSLSFDDYDLLCATLDRLLAGKENVVIVSGGAKGAELLGERYAREHGLGLKQFLADWETYGRGAKVIRNAQLIDAADQAVFFWDGKSKGAADAIETAEAKGIPVEIVLLTSRNWLVDNQGPASSSSTRRILATSRSSARTVPVQIGHAATRQPDRLGRSGSVAVASVGQGHGVEQREQTGGELDELAVTQDVKPGNELEVAVRRGHRRAVRAGPEDHADELGPRRPRTGEECQPDQSRPTQCSRHVVQPLRAPCEQPHTVFTRRMCAFTLNFRP